MAISLSNWLGRMAGHSEKVRRHRREAWREGEFLAGLVLGVVACGDPLRELPGVLQSLQERLNRGRSYTDRVDVLVALRMPGTPALSLVAPAHTAVPPELVSSLAYQLAGPVESPCTLVEPDVGEPVYALVLSRVREEAPAWLLLRFARSRPGTDQVAHRYGVLCSTLGEGLRLSLAHQRQLQQAVGTERREYAAELHDSVAQELGYLRLKTARLMQHCEGSGCDRLSEAATVIHEQTHRAYRRTRELINMARMSLKGSLHTELMGTVEEFEKLSGLVFELDDRAHSLTLPRPVALQVLLIVRESLSNSVRHAHASHVRIQLLPRTNGGLLVRVEDNGRGLSGSEITHGSFGLDIMSERAGRIGARLWLGDRPGGGTRIELKLDMQR
ncbi:sensor histidine kinase [Billgrantia endophytica]|uniref:histidine kinase n=1 Tax=Billgrantia endophytica TaxID=2033802 RepID=A0A2N7TXV4_9GAMM|nr:ATP-binding protein [Halomonas endophytica]PMR72985.1 hypothetical protein C1H69_19120 [Halomonas endophytica]